MPKNDGTIGVRASSGGRPITLEPLNETTDLAVPARRVESTIPCGFQVNWSEGSTTLVDGTEVTFEVNCGAGVASQWMTLRVTDADGETYALECLSLYDVVGAWLARVGRDGRTPKHAPLVVPRPKMDTPTGLFAGACVCGWVSDGLESESKAHRSAHQHVDAKLAAESTAARP